MSALAHLLCWFVQRLPKRLTLGFLYGFVLFLRWNVGGFWTWLQYNIWMHLPWAHRQDGKQIMTDVKKLDWLYYGDMEDEFCHKFTPVPERRAETERSHPGKPSTVLYVHGGGFVFASSSVLFQSVTYFCSSGFTVYSMDYPLAPEHPFPTALISVLRCLNWLRTVEGVERVVLLGDSAGANLVSMAAAFIRNEELFRDFAEAAEVPQVCSWEYPELVSMACLYGLLDQTSWRGRKLKALNWYENYAAMGGIAGCLELYRSPTNVFDNKLCLADILEKIEDFPPTLFIGGSYDPLAYSTIIVHEKLSAQGFDVHCKLYPARHGFFGPPPQWTFGLWEHDAKPASQLIVDFFTHSHMARRRCSKQHDGQPCCMPGVDTGKQAFQAIDETPEEPAVLGTLWYQ